MSLSTLQESENKTLQQIKIHHELNEQKSQTKKIISILLSNIFSFMFAWLIFSEQQPPEAKQEQFKPRTNYESVRVTLKILAETSNNQKPYTIINEKGDIVLSQVYLSRPILINNEGICHCQIEVSQLDMKHFIKNIDLKLTLVPQIETAPTLKKPSRSPSQPKDKHEITF